LEYKHSIILTFRNPEVGELEIGNPGELLTGISGF
jgi:hypothetical protein